jgi:hypothetical protein
MKSMIGRLVAHKGNFGYGLGLIVAEYEDPNYLFSGKKYKIEWLDTKSAMSGYGANHIREYRKNYLQLRKEQGL